MTSGSCSESKGGRLGKAGNQGGHWRAFRGEPDLAAAKAYNDMATWHQADAVVVITNQINSVGVVYLVNEGCMVDMSSGLAEFITGS